MSTQTHKGRSSQAHRSQSHPSEHYSNTSRNQGRSSGGQSYQNYPRDERGHREGNYPGQGERGYGPQGRNDQGRFSDQNANYWNDERGSGRPWNPDQEDAGRFQNEGRSGQHRSYQNESQQDDYRRFENEGGNYRGQELRGQSDQERRGSASQAYSDGGPSSRRERDDQGRFEGESRRQRGQHNAESHWQENEQNQNYNQRRSSRPQERSDSDYGCENENPPSGRRRSPDFYGDLEYDDRHRPENRPSNENDDYSRSRRSRDSEYSDTGW